MPPTVPDSTYASVESVNNHSNIEFDDANTPCSCRLLAERQRVDLDLLRFKFKQRFQITTALLVR